MSWFSFSPSGEEVGKQVLKAYFDSAVNFPEFSFTDYDAWIVYQNNIVPEFEKFIGDLILMNYASTSVGEAEDRLLSLASQSGGKAKIQDITAAAGGRGDTVNWTAGIPEVAIETAVDTAEYAATVAQNVGTGVMGTLSLVKYLPWILGGGAALYIVVKGMGIKSGKKFFL